MINILIADSFYLSRSGLLSILSKQREFNVVCQTSDSHRLLADIQNHQPDVVIIDVQFQPECPLDVVQEICKVGTIKFLVLVNEPKDPNIIHLLRAGAHGCIQKDAGEDSLIQAVRDVASDRSPLSPSIACELLLYLRNLNEMNKSINVNNSSLSHREVIVLLLISKGLPNKIIGNQLKITERTVEAHVRNILKKLNATNRTQAVFLATKNGWLPQTN
jgi:two-component system, NarL family, response regulator DevR